MSRLILVDFMKPFGCKYMRNYSVSQNIFYKKKRDEEQWKNAAISFQANK